MVYKEHFIELWCNGNKVELEDQKSLNMRFNNVLIDPTKISSSQGEYSFEFEVPCTPHNNVIFDYANNLSKTNKFHQRYNAEVYCDGYAIFSGSITLNGVKDNRYSLNLVSVKVYSLDEIFGDMTMDKIKNFKIDFDGSPTINYLNNQTNPDVCFPFVSYGAFQKSPYSEEGGINIYTSKFDIDEWNRWYVESFPPSHNMLKTLRKAFESVDYQVGGDVFSDNNLKKVYMSVNLADGQSPDYNVGNPKFGSINLSAHFTNNSQAGYTQSLKYPYFKVGGTMEVVDGKRERINAEYNLTDIQLFDILSEGTVTVNQSASYMYQPNEHLITIPADGFYKIELYCDAHMTTTGKLTANLYQREAKGVTHPYLDPEIITSDVDFTAKFDTTCPLEIQLVKNYDDDIELIKGKNNMVYVDGCPDNLFPDNLVFLGLNRLSFYGCFPHEKIGYFSDEFPIPTKTDTFGKQSGYMLKDSTDGYVYGDGEIMAYDPIVNPNFICGFSSMGNDKGAGCSAVIKNGYSWSKQVSERYYSFFNNPGYKKISRSGGSYPDYNYVFTQTDYNKNNLLSTPAEYFNESVNGGRMSGRVYCIVYLHKNDRLQLFAIHRDYTNEDGETVTYNSEMDVQLNVTAFSPRPYDLIKKDGKNDMNAPVEFDTQLNLANFFNKEKKVSEWVQNIADAFNLDIIQDGKTVTINSRKKLTQSTISAIDIDDRVNSADAESSSIDYPRSMAVKYKIDTDEWGFERSAVEAAGGDESILNDDDWVKYGDSGFSIVQLNDDMYATSTSDKNLAFSYTWYQNFNWYAVNSSFHKTSNTPVTLRIPCISKYSYMIDGYNYEESMKHDGFGQAQRFWFKPEPTSSYVWTRTYPAEQIMLHRPKNLDVINLSYKDSEKSLLSQYFNFSAFLASNYITVEVYLNPEEYNAIKNGSLVHFDSDIYIPVEISGYDPTCNNPTELKLMKKVN